MSRARPITVESVRNIKGNRAYVLQLRKACSAALASGVAAFTCEDEDGDDATTTITCSGKLKVRGSKELIGFKK